jgi:hypothetical protein
MDGTIPDMADAIGIDINERDKNMIGYTFTIPGTVDDTENGDAIIVSDSDITARIISKGYAYLYSIFWFIYTVWKL